MSLLFHNFIFSTVEDQPKEKTQQPTKGKYSDWKEILAEEGFNQCVYCAIPDACFGGIRNFHVEHYRPKSKFKKLENNIIPEKSVKSIV